MKYRNLLKISVYRNGQSYSTAVISKSCHRTHSTQPQMFFGMAIASFGWLAATSITSAQSVPLGGAQNFGVISSQGLTSSGNTIINGNVALSPLTTITGFTFSSPPGPGVVNGTVHYADGIASQAQSSSLTAYNSLAGMAYLPANDLTGLDLGGMSLAPGVYHFETSAGLTGNLTLATSADPNAVYVFQIGSTLTTAVGSSLTMTGAGSAANVFWQVGSSATLNTGTAFGGNIIALASVSMGTGSSLTNGRLIALNGAVSMLGNSISQPILALAAPGRYWNGSAGNLWSSTNWSSTVAGLDQIVLGSNVDVVFSVNNTPINQSNTILDSDVAIASLTVNDPTPVGIGGTKTLTLSTTGLVTGINVNTGAGATTIGSNLVLGNLSQVITVNNAGGLLVSGVIGGINGLTKAGIGLLTLTATETYTGATVVSSGTLQLGNGLTAGTSIATSGSGLVANGGTLAINLRSGESFGNNVTNNGRIQWIASGTNTQSATSVFNGSGSMQVIGSGTTILLGNNTFGSGTTINTSGTVLAGNLSAATSTAYGNGALTINNGYVDTFQSKVLQINTGGYVQTGGEIGIHVQGTTLGSYTRYNALGNSNLSGGTVFVYDASGIYVPQGAWSGNPMGDTQNIIRTTTGLSGQFASNAPFSRIYNSAFDTNFFYHQGDTLLYPTLTYDSANAYVTWVQDSFRSIPGLTPNPIAVGGGLDDYQDQNPSDPGDLITYLDGQNINDLTSMYNLIAPDELTALFQIGFSNAEIQNTNIARHLEQVRQGAGSDSPAQYTPSTRDSKGGMVEGTRIADQDTNRWSVFIEGTGGSASVDSTRNASGYDFDTLGFTLGADKRVSDNFAIGILGAYARSDASLINGGSIDIDSYKGAVYATAFANGYYLDALLGGGYNSYDTDRSALLGNAEGDTDGWELDTLLNGGYDVQKGNWTFGPTVSVAYTRVSLNEFTESGSLAPLTYPDQTQESLRTGLGGRISYNAMLGSIRIRPQARLVWQHEFLDSTQSIDSQFATGNSSVFTVDGPEIGRDRAILSIGLSAQFTPTLTGYVFYDGQLGAENYSSNSVSCGLKLDF